MSRRSKKALTGLTSILTLCDGNEIDELLADVRAKNRKGRSTYYMTSYMPHALGGGSCPDGREERVRYGYYESVLISHENGHPVNRCRILVVPHHPVHHVRRYDGVKIVFDAPLYCIELRDVLD